MSIAIADFLIHRPQYESTQEHTLDWLIEAHRKSKGNRPDFKNNFWRVVCGPVYIAKRGHVLKDFNHLEWDKMRIYNLNDHPAGKTVEDRLQLFEMEVDRVFEAFYQKKAPPPHDLIHVTCTGYVSPSGAQKLVARKNWKNTSVTHAYHMGCYASISAIKIASGLVSVSKKNTDIVHTELCSLHVDPSSERKDHWVTQSLFADGFIKYSSYLKSEMKKPHLEVIALHEEIIPNSEKSMTWNVSSHGFAITLAKEVPVMLRKHLGSYLERLALKAKIPVKKLIDNALFAVHPGGPKIIQQIQSFFSLHDEQLVKSRHVLREYGNMSSATLPHIWAEIMQDETILENTLIVCLAFGPGLSICGAVLKKCGC